MLELSSGESTEMPAISERMKEDQGAALVLVALCLSILLAFMGLAVDIGLMFQAKRKMQTAADAAAVAAAADYMYNGSTTSAVTAARTASSNNGYTDGGSNVTVTVNNGPSSGPSAGKAGYFETIVSQPVPTFFMAAVGHKTMNISARAVAGTPRPGDVCIWVMNPSGADMNLQGSYDVEAPNCGIYDNSPATNSFSTTGNGGIVNAMFLDVVGNSPPAHQTTPTPATINAAPRTSPWGNLTGPTPTNGGCTITSSATSITGTITGPGATSAICYTNAVTITNATLGPGTYMFENGVTLSGTVTVNSGTIDVYNGSLTQGNAVLNITAPTSGTYNAVGLMQPASNTTQLQVQFGSSGQTFDTYIYAPGAQVYLQDNGGGSTSAGIVAGTFYVKASKVTIPSYDKAHPTTTPNRVVCVTE